MSAPQGVFDFPGVLAPIDGKYNCNHGIAPGRILLRAAYQVGDVSNVGPLRISYGTQYFDVKDCKVVERINYYDSNSGWVSEFLIEDRRWRWRFGEIEGDYNHKLSNGKIDPACERTPHELAELLFRAMKERRYEYSNLPNKPRPEVTWAGSNPAQELERLVTSLGCRVVYDSVSDTVTIEKTGKGQPLPNISSVDQYGVNLFRPAVPSGIRVVGVPSRIQMALPIKPVLLNEKGEIVDPETSDLATQLTSDVGASTSSGGRWYHNESPEFVNVSNDKRRDLCKKSMWRYWQIDYDKWKSTGQAYSLGDYLRVSGDQLKIENVSMVLNREQTDSSETASKQGYVVGLFRLLEDDEGPLAAPQAVQKNTTIAEGNTIYEGGVQAINEFDEPLFITSDQLWLWQSSTGGYIKVIPDELYCLCTFTVRYRSPEKIKQNTTCSLHRFNYYQRFSNESNIGPEVYHDDSLQLLPYEVFSLPTLTTTGTILDNLPEDQLYDKSRDIILNRAERYQSYQAGNASYQEFVLVRMDGAIQSIVWSFGESGATTDIYRNSEPDFLQTKYDRRVTNGEIARRAGVLWP